MAQYSLDPISSNCYPDSTVLINKFGITDESSLLDLEIAITQEAIARWEKTPLSSSFNFNHYKAIHKHLFDELYDWAGHTRDVNISKKGTRFCPYDEIEAHAGRIFSRLRATNVLVGLKKNAFVSEFVELYMVTNYLHPFREGNGRTQRLFLSQLARYAGYSLNFADIDTDNLMVATIQSAHGVRDGLNHIFKRSINTPKKPSLLDDLQMNIELVEQNKLKQGAPKRSKRDMEL